MYRVAHAALVLPAIAFCVCACGGSRLGAGPALGDRRLRRRRGGADGRQGSLTLPAAGAPIVTSSPIFPSRQVPSWIFGDGTTLLNGVNADFGIAARITRSTRSSRRSTPRASRRWASACGGASTPACRSRPASTPSRGPRIVRQESMPRLNPRATRSRRRSPACWRPVRSPRSSSTRPDRPPPRSRGVRRRRRRP